MGFIEDGIKYEKVQTDDKKKTVYLIGDSIRIGYCESTKDELSDIADVIYPEENCRSSQHIITSLNSWRSMCDCEKVDLVQFNCGHWDVAHWFGYETCLTGEKEYANNIKMIIWLIREFFPNAKIVFATTTPMNPQKTENVNPRTTEEIKRYNDIAIKTATEEGIIVNDLFEFTKDWKSECYLDYCHYTKESFKDLGVEVANRLRSLL